MAYQVTNTKPTTYIDTAGLPVRGYDVTIYLPDFNESHILQSPSLDPAVIDPLARDLVDKRNALADLGG